MYFYQSISSQDCQQFGTTCTCISQSAVRNFNNLEQHVLVSVNQQSGLSTIWNNMYLYQSISSQDCQQFGTTCTCVSQSAVRTGNNLQQHVLVSVNQQSGLSTIWNNMYFYQSISSQDCQQFGTTCTCISQSAVRNFNNLEQHVLVSVNQQSGLSTIWNNMYLYQSISSQEFQQFGTTCSSISQSAVRTVNNLEQHVLVSVNQQSGLSTIWNNMYLYQSISRPIS